MKRLFGNIFIFLTIILTGVAAAPWNDLTQWGLNFDYISENEVKLKMAIGGLMLIFALIFLFLANHEYNSEEEVSHKTARAAYLPLLAFAISMAVFAGSLMYYAYAKVSSTTNLLILGFIGLIIVNLIGFGHMLGANFRKESNGKRILHFVFLVEVVAVMGGFSYWMLTYYTTNYPNFNSFYFAGALALAIVLYIFHSIYIGIKRRRFAEDEQFPTADDEFSRKPVEKPKAKKSKTQEPPKDDNRTIIVSREQNIYSASKDIDPTNIVYQDVSVDPEFSKTKGTQPNSIEYYIEKPKMFKPLDPSFDELVAYIRQLPHVITKIDDDKITFYVDRKPFLVLVNLGDYYRLAFKYDLEKGIRLIIKYPTISKNKSTRDELWFKANNYGDLPKEVIYQIVKTAYDNVNA